MKKTLSTIFNAFRPEIWLSLAAVILLGGWLGGHDIWTQEYRWQQVCLHMMQTGDYWHPYLDGKPYYDKPLLSYWIIIGLAKLNHGVLSNTILRLPSLFSGLITLVCSYALMKRFFNREIAVFSSWLLLTTFYFVFWARVASADILNVAAIMMALWWFFKQNNQHTFWRDLVFFLLLAIGALLKGLIAPALVFLILIPELWRNQYWRSYIALKPICAMLIAAGVYLAPFIISGMHQGNYQENGLVEVFRENILRFFKPFDHEGGIQTYFIFLPLYTLPWFPLWILAFAHIIRNYKHVSHGERWLSWSLFIIFVFLSLSGSRRSYYILPAIPFAIMLASVYGSHLLTIKPYLARAFRYTIAAFYIAYVGFFVVMQPLYYMHR